MERLLSITGEDTLTIDRKYREPWTGKLPTRFVMLTNELPKFRDAPASSPTGLLILRMTESFLGREDHELGEQVCAPSCPGILSGRCRDWTGSTATAGSPCRRRRHDVADHDG